MGPLKGVYVNNLDYWNSLLLFQLTRGMIWCAYWRLKHMLFPYNTYKLREASNFSENCSIEDVTCLA